MGAWGEGPFENDTAADWLCGVAEVLNFVVRSAAWSQWDEEVLAAAALLTQQIQKLKDLAEAEAKRKKKIFKKVRVALERA